MKRLILLLCLVATTAWGAPDRYVTDELQVDLRSGPSNRHRIVRMLDAGQPLNVLENAEGWSRVRTTDGVEGWLLTRYLSRTPSARDRLAVAVNAREKAERELQTLKQNLGQESQRLLEAQKQLEELTASNEEMKRQLADAARGIAMATENRELKKQVVDLQRQIEMLENEAERLSDRSQRDWFVVGALVVFAGFITGIIVTRIRWRKKSSWSSL